MTTPYIPQRVFYEEQALNYDLGKHLVQTFRTMGIEIKKIASHNRVTGIPGNHPAQSYREGKNTLVIGVRRDKTFQTCKPSAHYQLPLVTGCSGMCEYCYLATNLGKKPYTRVYVNLEEILQQTQKLIDERKPEVTLFEGSAVSDPVPVERYTGCLRQTIEFFSRQEWGRFRFVTKFTDIDGLLDVGHNQRTTIRFSINSDTVIKDYEHRAPGLSERLEAAHKVLGAGYPLGFLIAPILVYPGWQEDYQQLFKALSRMLHRVPGIDLGQITLELISHRYTTRAKNNIMEVFPNTKLEMIEEKRKFKYGQFGYGKYIYPPEEMDELKTRFKEWTDHDLPGIKTLYFV